VKHVHVEKGRGQLIGTNVTQFLIEEQRRFPTATGDLTLVMRDIVTACKAIALAMRYGRLSAGDVLGTTSTENVHGEAQRTLDILANELFVQHTAFAGHIASVISEEMELPRLPGVEARGRYLLAYDPVDGSSNIGESASIGTIFSVLRRPDGATGHPTRDEFLQPGTRQVCAGYAIYGPSCMLVITTGNGVNGFTLDPGLGEFLLTHPKMTMPEEGSRLCVNVTQLGRWVEPITEYVSDRVAKQEAHEPKFDVRWSGCAVADVHRLLVAGGIYFGPVEEPAPGEQTAGKLRLLYEVNPLAMIVEQAGGLATTGRERAVAAEVDDIHQQVPIILGSRREVNDLLTGYLDLPAMG
jgi:fructose-1,6-bisphosphatase I